MNTIKYLLTGEPHYITQSVGGKEVEVKENKKTGFFTCCTSDNSIKSDVNL